MYSKVREYIHSRIMIPDEDLEKSFQYSNVRCYKKGEYILCIGDYCRFIGFVNSGLIVNTMITDDGKEIACNFIFENCFFTYTEGLNNNTPSHKNSIALEDCEMLILEKEKLPMIFSINSKFETLFTKILAEELRNVLLSEQYNRTQSAENKYLQFINTFPEAFNRIPLKYIAGYLGIEPPSLSRLRKKLAGK
ncbi:Crp/Fnr family transcriptional regulator [Panacibacter ginsenosidivorans]|uniref:Crp/Fnr family transcriptional regulator n=1 Tax=Panacibacter ginsenosidivorans TaxID=1813871 RepID=A0A5B8VFX8_9BACT|nr:Crp/Fnr family transcriptional regulator [Panacibacter ginsenosidivorans]QEC69238.1 Crp/Fnr family transcriptional regulator [Panacibacter ginsenosidivorans]